VVAKSTYFFPSNSTEEKMTSITRDIQRCINRFEFALLLYYEGGSDVEFYDALTTLEELLKNDLLRTFHLHSVDKLEE